MRQLPLPLPLFASACLVTACATAPTGPVHKVVYLRHTKASEMAETVEQFLAEARALGTDYPSITAHESSNSLLLRGNESNLDKVLTLIANLDVERPK